jgi:uncharacterized integral membrane protein
MRGQGFVILAIVLTILIAIFAVINIEPVEVNYFYWSATSPLILVILFSVLMGGLITAIAGMVKIYQMRKKETVLKKENKDLRELLKKEGVPASKLPKREPLPAPKKQLEKKN